MQHEAKQAGPPAFDSFQDVRRLLEHRGRLRSDVQELERTKIERCTLKSFIAPPDVWRACTSPSGTHVGSVGVLRDTGAKGRLSVVNLTEIDREIGQKREELRTTEERLLTAAVVWADRFLPLPACGFWALSQTEGMPAAIAVDLSVALVVQLDLGFGYSTAGALRSASDVRRAHPDLAAELDALSDGYDELWFARAGRTPPQDPHDAFDDEDGGPAWGKQS
jgi:hypothetical protein